MPEGIGYQDNGQPIPGMPQRGSGIMDALNFFLNGAGRSQSTGQSFFSPQFELLNAFQERGLDQQYGRPQKQEGALGNVPGFLHDIANYDPTPFGLQGPNPMSFSGGGNGGLVPQQQGFHPTTPFSEGIIPSTGSPDPMAAFQRAFNTAPGGRAAFDGNERSFRKAIDQFRLGQDN